MAYECPAFTASPFLNVDGLLISPTTGEIFGYDDKPSVFSERPDYRPELSKCRSADDLNAVLSHVDRRKLPPHTLHSLIDAQDQTHGVWRRTGVDSRITVPMMNILSKLHELVLYRNMIIMTQADLAKALGTTASNLMKKLSTLISSNMVRVSTSRTGGIRTGEIKLTVNPRLIFRGDDAKRDVYIEHWYRDWTTLHPQSASSMNRRGWDENTNVTAAIAA
ncbi:replication/maintenance protein RepL [Pseudomonas sp. B21-032]|uniref:replication/maintenance protein RepL n=1 Tax=Pseudomonas sp. B21-032 TaxID=2895483 RepID=UPI00215F64FB|nr:replication/maintenance protein RepL [Pseudomonas sp. B21-032]UVL63261.1 replication/maintenance protein RepL [Pseudomonas sp. B21-032]